MGDEVRRARIKDHATWILMRLSPARTRVRIGTIIYTVELDPGAVSRSDRDPSKVPPRVICDL